MPSTIPPPFLLVAQGGALWGEWFLGVAVSLLALLALAVLVLGGTSLDRDVVHFAFLGALLGAAIGWWNGLPPILHALFGMFLGGAAGDALRARSTLPLQRAVAARGGLPWWRRSTEEPAWLGQFAVVTALTLLLLNGVLLGVLLLGGWPFAERLHMADDFAAAWRSSAPESAATWARFWYVHLLAALALTVAVPLWRRSLPAELREARLSRGAALHGLALLLLAADGLVQGLSGAFSPFTGEAMPAGWYAEETRRLAADVRALPPAALTLSLSLLGMGPGLWRYARYHAWLPALGVIAVLAAVLRLFHNQYCLAAMHELGGP